MNVIISDTTGDYYYLGGQLSGKTDFKFNFFISDYDEAIYEEKGFIAKYDVTNAKISWLKVLYREEKEMGMVSGISNVASPIAFRY